MVAYARLLLAKCRCAYDDHHIHSEGGSPKETFAAAGVMIPVAMTQQ